MKKDVMTNATIAMLNSTTAMRIIPTAAEIMRGRLMRAPDHSAGDDNGSAAPAGDGDANADTGAAATGDAPGGPPADTSASAEGDAGNSDADATAGGSTDGSIIGDAAEAKEGEGDDDKEDKEDDDKSIPETYELKPFKIGEGDDAAEVQIDAALLEEATPLFKEAGLTQQQLDKLAPVALKLEEKFMERQQEAFAAVKTDWAKATKDDPEIGGKNMKATIDNVAKALDFLGHPSVKDKDGNETDPFRQLVNHTGVGNHPEFVRAFAKIGALASEDGALPRGDKGAAVQKSREEILFPNDVPKPQQGT
jgi:hypothetical protein